MKFSELGVIMAKNSNGDATTRDDLIQEILISIVSNIKEDSIMRTFPLSESLNSALGNVCLTFCLEIDPDTTKKRVFYENIFLHSSSGVRFKCTPNIYDNNEIFITVFDAYNKEFCMYKMYFLQYLVCMSSGIERITFGDYLKSYNDLYRCSCHVSGDTVYSEESFPTIE